MGGILNACVHAFCSEQSISAVRTVSTYVYDFRGTRFSRCNALSASVGAIQRSSSSTKYVCGQTTKAIVCACVVLIVVVQDCQETALSNNINGRERCRVLCEILRWLTPSDDDKALQRENRVRTYR